MFHKLERSQINKIRALVKGKLRVHLIPKKKCKNMTVLRFFGHSNTVVMMDGEGGGSLLSPH